MNSEYNGFLKLLEKECIKGKRIIPIPHDYAMCILAEVKELKEDNEYLKRLCETQNNREYRSKFLKEFQKEHGKNVYPDYDEIYKRYDEMKVELQEANESITWWQNRFNAVERNKKQLENNRDKVIEVCDFYNKKYQKDPLGNQKVLFVINNVINILKGDSDE